MHRDKKIGAAIYNLQQCLGKQDSLLLKRNKLLQQYPEISAA